MTMPGPRKGTRVKYTDHDSESDEELKQTSHEPQSDPELSPSEKSDVGLLERRSTLPTDEFEQDDLVALPEPLMMLGPVPTESQLQQTRAFVAQKAVEVALLKVQYEEQKNISEELEKRLLSAEQVLFQARATIAPIGRLPPELFALIFMVHVHENHQSPWLLTQVSRTWRAAASMTSGLWGRIILTPASWTKSKAGGRRVRVWEGMEVCYKQVQLLHALRRAGGTLLDIKIMLPPGNRLQSWTFGVSNSAYDLLRLVDTVVDHRLGPRLCSLEIDTERKLAVPASKLERFKYGDLVSLSLDGNYPDVIDKVVNETRGLRTLRVTATNLLSMAKCKWWAGLYELAITDLYSVEDMTTIRSILSSSTTLRTLDLRSGDLGLSQDDSIHMPSLRRLNLTRIHNFWPINCPNLTHLSLIVPTLTGNLKDRSIELPFLVEMRLTCMRADNPLRVFDLPSFGKLDFQCAVGRAANANIFKSIWASITPSGAAKEAIEPRMFFLHSTEINPKLLGRILAGRRLLEEFAAVDVVINTEFFAALLPIQIQKRQQKSQATQGGPSTWDIGCIALKILTVDLVGRKVKEGQLTLETSAKALVAARIRAGAPLQRLAIRFSDDEGWKELVE